ILDRVLLSGSAVRVGSEAWTGDSGEPIEIEAEPLGREEPGALEYVTLLTKTLGHRPGGGRVGAPLEAGHRDATELGVQPPAVRVPMGAGSTWILSGQQHVEHIDVRATR